MGEEREAGGKPASSFVTSLGNLIRRQALNRFATQFEERLPNPNLVYTKPAHFPSRFKALDHDQNNLANLPMGHQ